MIGIIYNRIPARRMRRVRGGGVRWRWWQMVVETDGGGDSGGGGVVFVGRDVTGVVGRVWRGGG